MSDAASLLTQNYDYHLPDDRIARYPLAERDQSQLLVYRDGQIGHDRFASIGKYLPAGARLVANNTRVIAARLPMLSATGQPIELLLLEPEVGEATLALTSTGRSTWRCMVGGKKRWKQGLIYLDVDLPIALAAEWVDRDKDIVSLSWQPDELSLAEILADAGQMPLPPYLNRKATAKDRQTYQTTYARQDGAVAAPTAGLHMTPELQAALAAAGHPLLELTLHVGAGTFRPVKTVSLAEHDMHAERYSVPVATLVALAQQPGPIVPIGTTSMRTLESLYWRAHALASTGLTLESLPSHYPYQEGLEAAMDFREAYQILIDDAIERGQDRITGQTALFILPGYRFRVADALITNFHQPASTLVALVAAFVGPDWRRIYDTALQENYRFLSYGDSSLLFKR